jgi:hypothetical protein
MDINRAMEAIRIAHVRLPGITHEGMPGGVRLSNQPEDPIGLDQRSLEEVATAVAYLERLQRSLKRSRTCGSYSLKHRAEEWGEANGMSNYVSNGALLVAAVFLGFKVVQGTGLCGPSINADVTVQVVQ